MRFRAIALVAACGRSRPCRTVLRPPTASNPRRTHVELCRNRTPNRKKGTVTHRTEAVEAYGLKGTIRAGQFVPEDDGLGRPLAEMIESAEREGWVYSSTALEEYERSGIVRLAGSDGPAMMMFYR